MVLKLSHQVLGRNKMISHKWDKVANQTQRKIRRGEKDGSSQGCKETEATGRGKEVKRECVVRGCERARIRKGTGSEWGKDV